MLVKLEDELDVRIFERSNKQVKPTTVGQQIVQQAQKALMEADKITEIVNEGRGTINGSFALSVGPTISPYLLPKFIKHYREKYAEVSLTISELKAGKASILCSCEPVAAMLFGIFFFGEIPTVLSVTGLIIVLVALAMLVLSDKKQEFVEG